jgi:hypothetical protein
LARLDAEEHRGTTVDDAHENAERELLAIEDGLDLGATVTELNSDANLAAMCEACNLGLPHGPGSVNPRTYAIIMWRLVQAELRRTT